MSEISSYSSLNQVDYSGPAGGYSSVQGSAASETGQLSLLRDAIAVAGMEGTGDDAQPLPSPEDLLGGGSAAGQGGDQAAGMQAFVDGMLRQMLIEGLQKAGDPNRDR